MRPYDDHCADCRTPAERWRHHLVRRIWILATTVVAGVSLAGLLASWIGG